MLWGASPALSQPNPLLSSQDTGSAVSAAPEGVHEAMPDVSETPAPVVSEAVPKGAAADAPYRVFVRNLSILNGLSVMRQRLKQKRLLRTEKDLRALS